MTRDEFLEAVVDHKKSKSIKKQAEELEAAARKKILAYYEENPGGFNVAPDSESGKTWIPQTLPEGVKMCRITFPVKRGLPSRFDDARTVEALNIIEDTIPEARDDLFRFVPVFKPEGILSFCAAMPEFAPKLASLLMPFSLPATEDEPMSPRVEVK